MVLDVQPVAHVEAAPVTGSGLRCRAFNVISGMSFSGNWNGP